VTAVAVAFVSDLHLDSSRPEAIDRFARFMGGEARQAKDVYILGDLFEAWIGDDEDDAALMPVLDAIRGCTSAGVACFFMHGNRDFLIGDRFAAATGTTLLDEFAVIELFGERALLTHGDLLCTDDLRYLELRARLRNADWQSEFLSKSLTARREIAAGLRELSRAEMAGKDEQIMDVNQLAVEAACRRHDVKTLIHGHTHRPAMHQFELDGARARRIVLGDWYASGSCLIWTESGPEALPLS
jgi:UDP-2,3-diacylglucosamine hydrolase